MHFTIGDTGVNSSASKGAEVEVSTGNMGLNERLEIPEFSQQGESQKNR